jgi:spore maturation protein SpmA
MAVTLVPLFKKTNRFGVILWLGMNLVAEKILGEVTAMMDRPISMRLLKSLPKNSVFWVVVKAEAVKACCR